MDRVIGFYPIGCGFESCLRGQKEHIMSLYKVLELPGYAKDGGAQKN